MSTVQHTDLNLLFGVLALQMDFVSRDELVAAMNIWVLEKTRPLGQILVEQGMLAESRRSLVDSLVNEHLRAHDDTETPLGTLGPQETVRDGIADLEAADAISSSGRLDSTSADAESCGEATLTHAALPDRKAGGRFRLLRFHDRGGIGEVYVARDEEVGREVALKQIRPDHADNINGRARFLLEAEITGGLEH